MLHLPCETKTAAPYITLETCTEASPLSRLCSYKKVTLFAKENLSTVVFYGLLILNDLNWTAH